MYCLAPEKTLHLAPQGHFLRGVYEPFYLAISVTFYGLIKFMTTLLHKSRKWPDRC